MRCTLWVNTHMVVWCICVVCARRKLIGSKILLPILKRGSLHELSENRSPKTFPQKSNHRLFDNFDFLLWILYTEGLQRGWVQLLQAYISPGRLSSLHQRLLRHLPKSGRLRLFRVVTSLVSEIHCISSIRFIFVYPVTTLTLCIDSCTCTSPLCIS